MKIVPTLFIIVTNIIISWTPLIADSKDQAMDDKIEQFAKAYKLETSASKKRSLCLDAIDEGLFKRGDSVTIIDRLFGTNFAIEFISEQQVEQSGVVYFTAQPRQDSYNQLGHVGWYLYVSWDKTRTIQDYGLTNLHK